MPHRSTTILALGLLAGLAAACAPTRDAPCGPERPCETASADLCASGPEAALYGRAAFAHGTCVANDDAACSAASLTCRLWGQCSAPVDSGAASGGCPEAAAQPERERDFLASRNIACGAGRTCVANTDADCRSAAVCRLEGRCVARDGVCIAASDADCRASEYCGEVGWCRLVGTRCTAATAEDCRPSRACDDWGECGLAARNEGCTTCERSVDCVQEGLCERVLSADRCRATEDRHCQRSAACRSAGRCRALQGGCVK